MQLHKGFVKDSNIYLQKLKELTGWKKKQWRSGRSLPRLVYKADSKSDPIYAIIRPLICKIETISNSKVEGI